MPSFFLPFDLPEPPPLNPITGGKLDRELALLMAQRYLHLLEPVCSRIEIAGSIRRLKPLVKDIEIVAIEKYPGACFQVLSEYRAHSQLAPVDFWGAGRNARKGPRYFHFRDRRSYSPPVHGGTKGGLLSVSVDLFLSQPDYWGWTFFIRTGSHEWNLACMQRLHFLGLKVEHNRLYRFGKGSSLIPHPSSLAAEHDIFNLLRIPWIEPHLRHNAESLTRALYQASNKTE